VRARGLTYFTIFKFLQVRLERGCN
jgi:hypothetical protein